MDKGRPEPPPRPRIRAQGGPSGKVKGWRRWPGSWPGPAAWIRAGNFDRGKRGTGAEARPSRAHRLQAAPRCAGRTGAPGRNGRSRPRLPAGSGQPVAGGRFAGLGADLGPVPRWWPWCPAGRIMAEGRPEPPPRPRIRAQGGPSGKVKGAALYSDQGHKKATLRTSTNSYELPPVAHKDKNVITAEVTPSFCAKGGVLQNSREFARICANLRKFAQITCKNR